MGKSSRRSRDQIVAKRKRQGAEAAQLRAPGPGVDAVLDAIKARHERLNGERVPGPDPTSELAADDTAVMPYLVSGLAQSAIAQASDHLEAFRSLLQDLRVVHPWAQYTLLRGALENASTALWLIAPDLPDERRFRALRLAARDILDSRNAQPLHGQKPPSGRTHDERLDELKTLAAPNRRQEVGARPISYKRIVREAAEAAGREPDFHELLWRTLSGLAHGASWASLSSLPRSITETERADVAGVRFTGSPDTMLGIARLSMLMLERAEALWRRRAHLSE